MKFWDKIWNTIKMFFFKTRYFWKKFALALVTIFLVMIFGFILIKMMPGDPIDTYAQKLMVERGIPYEEARKLAISLLNYDPNASVWSQLKMYFTGLLHGDFGTSIYRPDVTVTKVIADFLPNTLFISTISLVISFFIGILLGTKMAYKRNSVSEGAISSYIVVSGAIPDYLWGMIFIFLFAVLWPIFPSQGDYDIILEMKGWPDILNRLYHAFLPIMAFSFVQTGSWALSMRGSSIGVLGEDYIYAAKARGIPERRIINKYLRNNAMLPLVTSLALSFAGLFGGSPLMESIFNYPGIGQQFSSFIGARDYFMIQGLIVFMSSVVIFANLITDSLYSIIDPRVRRDV